MVERRFNLAISPATRRFFMLVFVAAWTVPLAGKLIEARMVAPSSKAGLFSYHGTRGPWRGSVGATGTWLHPEGATDFVFMPGDQIVWEATTDVVPGTTVSAEFILMCNGLTIFATDFHVYAGQHRQGPANFGLTVPINSPVGDCGVRRSADFTAQDGQHEHKDFPVIPVRIAAPAAVSTAVRKPADPPQAGAGASPSPTTDELGP